MPATSGPAWSKEEIEILRDMRAKGMVSSDMQAYLPGRTRKAIECKATHLKLPTNYKPMPPHRVQTPRPASRPHRPAEIPRAGKTTLPPLPSLMGQDP